MWIISACIVKISHWIDYACSVKSETITLDRRVDLWCVWTSFLSEKIHGCIPRISLEYASHVLGYEIFTRYCLDSLSLPRWLERYSTGSISRESRSWQKFSCAIDCKLFNLVDSENIPNPFVTLVSSAPKTDKELILESNSEVQAHLKRSMSFADCSVTIPHEQYCMKMCSDLQLWLILPSK